EPATRSFTGAGDEDLAGRGARRHPSPDVDGNAPHIVAHQLALASVQPGPHLDPERADAIADGAGAADRARRSVKRREEAVAYRLYFATAEPPELAADERVVVGEQVAPPLVAHLGGTGGRADDVREQDRGQDAVEFAGGPFAGDELLRPLQDGVGVAGPGEVVDAGKFDVLCPGDVLRHVAGAFDGSRLVPSAMDDERRHPDRGQD